MELQLSDRDRVLVTQLRQRLAILVDVNSWRLDALPNGIILVACPDCDQRNDKIGYIEGLFRTNGKEPRIHHLGLNGGALLLPSASPLNSLEFPQGKVLMKNIKDAIRRKKGIEMVVVCAHAPCGAAADAGLSIIDTIDLLIEAKKIVKAECPDIKVVCLFHVDKGADRKRTYFVSRNDWERLDRSLLRLEHAAPECEITTLSA